MNNVKFPDINSYIAAFSPNVQVLLGQIRSTIKNAAPEAQEVISYQMPAFKLHGVLVYFTAYKNHIGFYPTASGIEVFKDQLMTYKFSKGAIQFPLDKPIPFELITQIVKYRVLENVEKAEKKLKKR